MLGKAWSNSAGRARPQQWPQWETIHQVLTQPSSCLTVWGLSEIEARFTHLRAHCHMFQTFFLGNKNQPRPSELINGSFNSWKGFMCVILEFSFFNLVIWLKQPCAHSIDGDRGVFLHLCCFKKLVTLMKCSEFVQFRSNLFLSCFLSSWLSTIGLLFGFKELLNLFFAWLKNWSASRVSIKYQAKKNKTHYKSHKNSKPRWTSWDCLCFECFLWIINSGWTIIDL